MGLGKNVITEQIDSLLDEIDGAGLYGEDRFEEQNMFRIRMRSAIERYAPPNSAHIKALEQVVANSNSEWFFEKSILRALRDDYAAGFLETITELIHADLFVDFLEMAVHLIEQGYKDPAAVIAGSVLEEHLRKLCDKNGIDVKKPDGTPKKADTLNSELAGVNVYSKLDQKNVTAWLDLRNKAAHGHYSEYTKDQVALLIQSVRDFITRNPA